MYCHKHGQGLATGRCEKCDDEVISLGIQADKDRIALLEDALKDARSALLYVRDVHGDNEMTTPIAQGPVDVNVRGLLDRLQAKADNAYCDYIGLCRRDECLGWEAKVEKGLFGDAELKAHKDAAERLGRHRALQEAASLLHELLTPNTEYASLMIYIQI